MATNYVPKLTGFPVAPPRGGGAANTGQSFRLGTLISDEWGNSYRYVKANEALTAGDAVIPVAQAAWDSGILVNGAVSSGKVIAVDNVTTAVAANYYRGYFIKQAAAASKGYAYFITGHDAFAASGSGNVHVEPTIGETFADNAALLIYHPWLVEKVDATTEYPIGICPYDIASGSYGFIQIGGYVPAVKVGHTTSNAIVVNEPLIPIGTGNEGALQGYNAGTPSEANILQAGLNRIVALEAVSSNTKGFIAAKIVGQL